MGAIGRLTESLFGRIIEEKVNVKYKEKLKEALQDPLSRRREDEGWRPITKSPTKDLNPLTQQKMQQICYFLYDKNGIGKQAIEIPKDFVIGDGLTYHIEDKKAKEIIDKHWDDPDNAWEIDQFQKAKEIRLYGEQAYPTFVNDINGHVKLGYVDPVVIDLIQADPDNAKKRVLMKYHNNLGEARVKSIINEDNTKGSETYGLLTGEAFWFTVNHVSNATRGRSDLFPVADAIDAYENFLFNRAERADIMNRIIYDLELKGFDQKQIEGFLRDFGLPKSNEFFAHNENLKLNVKVPELDSQDATGEARLLLNHILGGLRYPPTWFATGEGLTKGTATVMDTPTKKMLTGMQRYYKWMVGYIFRYQIHQAIIHKELSMSQKDVKIIITLPKIDEKEIQVVAQSLGTVTQSLTVAVEEGWLSNESARKIYIFMISILGQEIDIKKEDELRAKESKDIDPKLANLYKQIDEYRKTKKNIEDKIDAQEKDDEEDI